MKWHNTILFGTHTEVQDIIYCGAIKTRPISKKILARDTSQIAHEGELRGVFCELTHWGRMTHICVSKLTIIGPGNGLSPGRRQAIVWTNIGILLIGPLSNKLQWNLYRNSYIFIHENAFENVVWKMVAILSRPQCVKIMIRVLP